MIVYENILDLIPQKPPFVMVDKLVMTDETATQTTFLITPENIFVENGLFSEAGLLENMAQTAAVRAGYNSRMENKPVTTGYIGAVKNLEISFLPPVNDEIKTRIKIVNEVFGVLFISGEVLCNDKPAASCEMKIFMDKTKEKNNETNSITKQ